MAELSFSQNIREKTLLIPTHISEKESSKKSWMRWKLPEQIYSLLETCSNPDKSTKSMSYSALSMLLLETE